MTLFIVTGLIALVVVAVSLCREKKRVDAHNERVFARRKAREEHQKAADEAYERIVALADAQMDMQKVLGLPYFSREERIRAIMAREIAKVEREREENR